MELISTVYCSKCSRSKVVASAESGTESEAVRALKIKCEGRHSINRAVMNWGGD